MKLLYKLVTYMHHRGYTPSQSIPPHQSSSPAQHHPNNCTYPNAVKHRYNRIVLTLHREELGLNNRVLLH
jgi:hypothetical protein